MPDIELPFSRAEYAARLQKTRDAMVRLGIQRMIVTDPSNMAWLTGYDGWSFYVHQAVLVDLEDDPVWWGRGIDAFGALEIIHLDGVQATGFDLLANISALRELEVNNSDFNDAALAAFNGHPSLFHLSISLAGCDDIESVDDLSRAG